VMIYFFNYTKLDTHLKAVHQGWPKMFVLPKIL